MKKISFIFPIFVLLAVGCSPSSKAPEPFTMTEVVPSLKKEFVGAKEDTRAAIEGIVQLVEGTNYVDALAKADELSKNPSLSKKQRNVISRSRLALMGAINTAADNGDEKASDELVYRQANK